MIKKGDRITAAGINAELSAAASKAFGNVFGAGHGDVPGFKVWVNPNGGLHATAGEVKCGAWEHVEAACDYAQGDGIRYAQLALIIGENGAQVVKHSSATPFEIGADDGYGNKIVDILTLGVYREGSWGDLYRGGQWLVSAMLLEGLPNAIKLTITNVGYGAHVIDPSQSIGADQTIPVKAIIAGDNVGVVETDHDVTINASTSGYTGGEVQGASTTVSDKTPMLIHSIESRWNYLPTGDTYLAGLRFKGREAKILNGLIIECSNTDKTYTAGSI